MRRVDHASCRYDHPEHALDIHVRRLFARKLARQTAEAFAYRLWCAELRELEMRGPPIPRGCWLLPPSLKIVAEPPPAALVSRNWLRLTTRDPQSHRPFFPSTYYHLSQGSERDTRDRECGAAGERDRERDSGPPKRAERGGGETRKTGVGGGKEQCRDEISATADDSGRKTIC